MVPGFSLVSVVSVFGARLHARLGGGDKLANRYAQAEGVGDDESMAYS